MRRSMYFLSSESGLGDDYMIYEDTYDSLGKRRGLNPMRGKGYDHEGGRRYQRPPGVRSGFRLHPIPFLGTPVSGGSGLRRSDV